MWCELVRGGVNDPQWHKTPSGAKCRRKFAPYIYIIGVNGCNQVAKLCGVVVYWCAGGGVALLVLISFYCLYCTNLAQIIGLICKYLFKI